ncbi:MAG: uroporphyrinogen-III synthase, partial [Paracoccaceae bacterium]|nr:uroporphyrinogen-III synthase [Paracoccaceae bacterium]
MKDTRITLLLTRPLEQATAFAQRFIQSRLKICISPLLEIIFQANLPNITPYQSLIFTSANGVKAFASLAQDCTLPSFTVGQTTADIALAVGLPAKMLGLDVAELTAALQKQAPASPCLHLCGAVTAGNLAADLTRSGIPTDAAILYHQNPLPLSPAAQDLLRGNDPIIVPLFSPRSAHQFGKEWTQIGNIAQIYPVALSAAVATELPTEILSGLEMAAEPTVSAMESAINLVHARLLHLEQTD